MAAVWFYMINENQKHIEEILEEQEETKAVFTMREAAYQRTLGLSRMALMEDEFDQDEEYIKIKEQAGKFIAAREKFTSLIDAKKFPKEFAIWNDLVPAIRDGQYWQGIALNFLLEGKKEQALSMLLNEAMPAQNRVMTKLTALLKAQQNYTESRVEGTSQQNKTGLYIMGALAAWAIIWCLFIATYTIKRTTKTEQSLRSAQLKAQDADNQKSQFLANMSHEIRTPLTAIIGFSETLIEEEKSDDWKSYLHSIIRNGKHLHQLINDILDLSKIEANQLSIEQIPVSPCQILSEIESLMGERARNKGLHFEISGKYPIPKLITSDPTRLKQIIINLCGNAIKFTAEGRVSLKTHYEKESNLLYFDVEDSGIGMNQDQLANLFKPFSQADASTTRKFGGTGLGLYISKQLSEKLGGALSAESLEGVGSRFTVYVDAGDISQSEWVNSKDEAQTISSSLQSNANVPTLKGKILLAEDNPDNQRLISMHIRKTGAEVEVVENGKLAVERGADDSFDLILMDMQMPIMGGIEAISKLREKNCTTPIATLTANAMKEDALESEAAGANDFLTKPIDRHAFYTVLTRYLSPSSVNAQHTSDTPPPHASTATPVRTSDIPAPRDEYLDDIGDLIENYVRQLPETSYRIERLLSAKEWGELKSEIHQLKGTGGAFGFPEITDQCINIEKEMLKKDFDAASSLITNLNATCMNIVDAKAS
ncbi:MAG: ATP-binding protein [Desulfobacterales bacterium]|nr:ATP-binding protein [Desulfobacterales bacterium]